MTPATRIPMIANGMVDLECGTTTNTVERQKHVAFTVTTFVASNRLLSKRSSFASNLAQLRGRPVVSTAGTTSIKQLVELNAAQDLHINILAVNDHAEAFTLVETDRAVAFMMDDVLLYGLMANSKNPAKFAVSEDAWSIEPYGIGLPKGDPAFKKVADDALVAVFRSGEIQAIYRKWFQSPIPPRNINLELPMSAPLKKAIAHPTDSGDPGTYK